jgi:hypothetical protein
MNPIYLTAITTAIIVSGAVLLTVFNPVKIVPFMLSLYFAVIVLITK